MSVYELVIQWPTIPILQHSMKVLKCLKFLPLNVTMSVTVPCQAYRHHSICVYQCLFIHISDLLQINVHTVTEGVVHGLHKIVTCSRFSSRCSSNGYIRRVNINGGCLSVIDICTAFMLRLLNWLHTVSHQWLCASYLMDTPNLRRY